MPLLPSRRKGRGYLEDDHDDRDVGFDTMGLGSSGLPEALSMVDDVPEILDQGATNSCVAQTFAAAIGLVENRTEGIEYARVSRLFLYYNARRTARTRGPLFDLGTYLRTCAKGMERFGVPDEPIWPFSTFSLKVNRRPGWVAQTKALSRSKNRGDGKYVRIFEQGVDRTLAIRAALVAGHPVGFGTDVTDTFMRTSGDAAIRQPDALEKSIGGHAMLIVGYYTDNAGSTIFIVQNSWGTGWGDKGYCHMHEDYIRWRRTRDLWIIHGWRALQ